MVAVQGPDVAHPLDIHTYIQEFKILGYQISVSLLYFIQSVKERILLFATISRLALGNLTLDLLFLGLQSDLAVKRTIHLHLIPRLGMCGSNPDFTLSSWPDA
jgi:hypothetical protein